MTFNPLVLTDCRLYVDGGDLTGYSNKVEMGAKAAGLDRTTFGSGGWKERTGGVFDGSAMLEGFWQAGDPGQRAFGRRIGEGDFAMGEAEPLDHALGQLHAGRDGMLQAERHQFLADGEGYQALRRLPGHAELAGDLVLRVAGDEVKPAGARRIVEAGSVLVSRHG